MTATLRCETQDGLTATEAAAWFGAPSGQVRGFAFAPASATWLRAGPAGLTPPPGCADPLPDAYELVLFDGERELRWLRGELRGHHSRGSAVILWGAPPDTDEGASIHPTLTRQPQPVRRVLAGRPQAPVDGWMTLRSERYAEAALPMAEPVGAALALALEAYEYVGEDEHGNLDIRETRLARLVILTPADLQPTKPRGS